MIGELVVELDGETERAEDDVRDDEAHDERVGGSVKPTMSNEYVDDDTISTHSDHYDHHVHQHYRHLETATIDQSVNQSNQSIRKFLSSPSNINHYWIHCQ